MSSFNKSLSNYLSPDLKPMFCDRCSRLTNKGYEVNLTNLPRYLFTMVEKPVKKFKIVNEIDLKKCLSKSFKISSKQETKYVLVAIVARKKNTKTMYLEGDLCNPQKTDDDLFTVVRSHYNPFTKIWTWKKHIPSKVISFDAVDIYDIKMPELLIY
jgi:hypothetical protein